MSDHDRPDTAHPPDPPSDVARASGPTSAPPARNGSAQPSRGADDRAASSETFAELFGQIVANVETVVQGKRSIVELALICLVSEGHLLVEDVPGVGKTSLAKAIAQSISGSFGRVQFTPDVLPSDVLGVNVWDRASGEFRFRPGPVFTNMLLADEINRASPKTQAALLEAMEERQVTVDGHTSPLELPFMVIATQNPVEHEGTYPLPESQLDRFFMRLSMGYPSPEAAVEILERHGDDRGHQLRTRPVVTSAQIRAMAATVRSIHVATSLRRYIVELAETSRRHPALSLGVSPRATLALQRAARARAAATGRNYVIPEDVKELALPVLGHRLGLTSDAQLQGTDASRVVADLLRSVPVPDGDR